MYRVHQALALTVICSLALARPVWSKTKRKARSPRPSVVQTKPKPKPAPVSKAEKATPISPEIKPSTTNRQKQRVAIFNLRSPGQSKAQSSALMATLTEAVASVKGYSVISRDEIASMLDAEAQKQMLGCDDTGCLAEIAGALDVDLLVTGSVTPMGESYLLNLQLINQRYANVMNRVNLSWEGRAAHLPRVMCAAAQLLVLEPKDRPPVSLKITNSPEGAALLVDAKPMGEANDQGELLVPKLEVGVHKLLLQKSGFHDRGLFVASCSGKNIRVDGTMKKTPFYSSAWFWAGAGALTLATSAGIVTLVALSMADNTGRVEVALNPTGVAP